MPKENKLLETLKEEYSKQLYNKTWDEVVAMNNHEWISVILMVQHDQRFLDMENTIAQENK